MEEGTAGESTTENDDSMICFRYRADDVPERQTIYTTLSLR